MKILHIFHYSNLLNGVDRSTITLLSAWQEMGNVDYRVLVPDFGEVTKTLDKMGIPYKIAPLYCCTGPAKAAERNYLAHVAQRADFIEKWLIEERFDAIHLNTGHLLDGAIAGNRANVPVIWHIHSPFEIDYKRYSRFIQPETYAWILGQLGSRVLAVSQDMREGLLEWLPEEKVSLLYNGIDVKDLDTRAKQQPHTLRTDLGLNEATPLVLGVGRISAQKDFATFIRVAKLVTEQHPSVCFAIAGPAEEIELAQELPVLIDEFRLKDRCFILGPRNDVPALLAQCDVFLSTAIFEGQGLAALEAMTLGRPLVAMRCIGLRECISHEVDSLTMELGDMAGCAKEVLRVLNDKNLAERLGRQGRITVETKFSGMAHAEQFYKIAQDVRTEKRQNNNAPVVDLIFGLTRKIDESNSRIKELQSVPNITTRIKNKVSEILAKPLQAPFNQGR